MFEMRKLVGVLSCLAILCAAPAWAAEETQATAVGQSAINTNRSALDAVREKVAVSYYGIYYGASVSDPGASRQTTEWGKTGTNQFFLNYLNLSYKATPTLLPGISVLSTYTPVRGQDMTLLDPYLRLTDTALIRSGHFSLYSELREFLPVTADSHYAHRMSTLGTFQWLTYYIPGTRLSIGAWAKFYWSIYGSQATPIYRSNGIYMPSNDYTAFLRPQLFYTITPTVSASLYYEMQATHLLGKSAKSWDNNYTNLQLGSMWSVTQKLTLNPYLLFRTGGKVTTDTTAIGAQIFATIL